MILVDMFKLSKAKSFVRGRAHTRMGQKKRNRKMREAAPSPNTADAAISEADPGADAQVFNED